MTLSNLDNYRKYQKCFFANALISEAVARSCSVKKAFLEISQNSQENTCARVSFLIKLQAEAQVFSCEFCEISENTFSYRTPPVAASVIFSDYTIFF